MKGGNICRLRGRHLWLTLITLIFTTIFLWAWEKNPLVTTLLSAQDQFVMPYSEIFVDAPHYLSVSSNPKEHKEEEDAHSIETEEDAHSSETEETRNERTVQGFDAHSIETEETRNEQSVQGFDAHSIETEDTRNEQTVEGSDAHSIETEETRNEQTVQGFDPVPMDSTITLSPDRKENDRDVTSSSEKKVCNYAKGRWVEDSRRPLYSGFECKQWLSEMWACRLTQRTYFSYERYRWQPENCEMPEFERSAFLRRMQDKTIAFVGDSLGRQQFQSLMCMVTGGQESPEVQDVGRKYGLVKARGAIRPDGWAYWFPNTNTTILYYWSASLCDLQPLSITDRATDVAMHLDRPPAFLSRFLHRFDVVVLNTGHHWNRGKLRGNRWVMHVNGRPNEDKKLAEIGNAKNFTIFSVVRWLDSQFPSYPWLKVFFRTISPRHFVNGDWNTGGSCDNTIPLSSGREVWQNESSDPVIEDALKGTRVKILDITAISQLRDEGHISRYSKKSSEGAQDCLHWCLPGIPDTWNELLVAQL